MKIFVIAGNRAEADQWIKSNLDKRAMSGVTTLSWSDYVVVTDVTKLKGFSDPHGVFVGTWRERLDIFHIVEALLMQSVHVNKALGKIYSDLKPKIKPTPKLKKVSGGWINEQAAIDHAAAILAKEIDNEVLKQLTKKINGGLLQSTTISTGVKN